MIKRLLAFLRGAQRAGPAGRDPELYPIVGSSASSFEPPAATSWRAPPPASGDGATEPTLLALPPDPLSSPARAAQPGRADSAAEKRRLAWPARDLSRSRPVTAPQPDDATVIVSRFQPERRPVQPLPNAGDEATILVTPRGKSRPPAS